MTKNSTSDLTLTTSSDDPPNTWTLRRPDGTEEQIDSAAAAKLIAASFDSLPDNHPRKIAWRRLWDRLLAPPADPGK